MGGVGDELGDGDAVADADGDPEGDERAGAEPVEGRPMPGPRPSGTVTQNLAEMVLGTRLRIVVAAVSAAKWIAA